MNLLSPQVLDDFAEDYYMNPAIADVGIEELGQQLSLSRTIEAVKDAERILEMGYGTGLVTGELVARGLDIEVVEGSPRLSQVARDAHGDKGLVVHTAMFEEFTPVEPYDAILALHIAEHVEDPRALFTRVHSWLRPGGALIVIVPNADSLHRRLAVRMGLQSKLDDLSDRDHLVGHVRVYDFARLGADLVAAGFSVDEEFGYQLKIVPNSMMLDWPQTLLESLIEISPELPASMLANIGIRAIKQ